MRKKGQARVPTEAELKRLATIVRAERHALRNYALLTCSYKLGLRAHELAALKVGDVVDDRGELYEEVQLRRTKGSKPRMMYLTNLEVRGALKRYLEERKRKGALRPEEALFLSQKDGGFSANSLQHLFGRVYRAAGIHGASSHSGRRHFATNLIHKGIDLKAVSVLMGHSSVAVTARYVDDNPHRLRKVIADLT